MNPVSKDIADLLTEESDFGLVQAVNLFIAREPPEPDNCVTIYDLQGGPPGLTLQKETSNLYTVGFLIRVRANAYNEAYAQLRAYSGYLHGLGHFPYGDNTQYEVIKATTEPQLIAWDDQDRPILFVNFECIRKPLS